MSHTYQVEYTDTFAGEANYSWVIRKTIIMPELTHYGYTGSHDGTYAKANRVFERELVRRAKSELGLTGVKCKRQVWGDMIVLYPRNTCTVIFISYKEE